MSWVALRMLTGDRTKYLAIIFGVAFACFLIAEQSATFCGVMRRTTSQIRDTHGADIWVMNNGARYVDDLKGISDNAVLRVRGVPGVAWAVNLYRGPAQAQLADGHGDAPGEVEVVGRDPAGPDPELDARRAKVDADRSVRPGHLRDPGRDLDGLGQRLHPYRGLD